MEVKSIPEGYENIIPHVVVKDAAKAIDFYKKVFGAKELYRNTVPGDESKIIHSVITIRTSKIMVVDEFPQMYDNKQSGQRVGSPLTIGGNSVFLNMYFDDVDDIYKKATDEGASVVMPLSDVFWGDRYGQIKDPFGHIWEIATHKKDMTKDELDKAAKEFFEQNPNW
jgi:PhnB protein